MSVDFYIHKLLFSNDCVIVPGFGGFVTNYASAKIHPINHTFYPPSKSILFNSKLLQDDGLLIHHISQNENIDYKNAKLKVIDFVASCKAQLESSKNLDLLKIGKIRRDVEGSLLFDPETEINYLEESFGLPTFVSPAIIRQPIHKRLEKKFIDRRPIVDHSKSKRKFKWTYLLIIPILIFATWLTFNIGNNNNNTQESGILPVNETEYNISDSKKSDASIKEEAIPEELHSDLNIEPEQNEIDKADEVVNSEVIETVTVINYYIVGGAFRNPNNSVKMLNDLCNKGYDAKSAGLSKTGLHMVCYLQTSDRVEALMNLSIIKKKENPSAWLLKK